MSALKLLTGTEFLSFSTMSQYMECGERFRLERVEKVQRGQAWWFLGGDAFHLATELLDNRTTCNPVEAWEIAWSSKLAELTDRETVQCGGRRSSQHPGGENCDWWEEHGPKFVAAYLRWRNERKLMHWQLVDINGEGGIEVPFRFLLNGVPVQGVIDRVWRNGSGQIIATDYKAGLRAPSSNLQLRIYGAALQHMLGESVRGAYYMARTSEFIGPMDLRLGDLEELGNQFAHVRNGIESGVFLPNPSQRCCTCPVREHCSEFIQSVDSHR